MTVRVRHEVKDNGRHRTAYRQTSAHRRDVLRLLAQGRLRVEQSVARFSISAGFVWKCRLFHQLCLVGSGLIAFARSALGELPREFCGGGHRGLRARDVGSAMAPVKDSAASTSNAATPNVNVKEFAFPCPQYVLWYWWCPTARMRFPMHPLPRQPRRPALSLRPCQIP